MFGLEYNTFAALFIVLFFFGIGDFLGAITKAKLSSVFVALILFLVGFMSGVIPKDIISDAGLTEVGKWGSLFLVFHMGTMINLGEIRAEWRTVLMALISMVVVFIGLFVTLRFIPSSIMPNGRETAIATVPIINGGLVATQLMSTAALDKGLDTIAALCALVYAVQKFVGTPFTSFTGVKEANNMLVEYRAGNAKFEHKNTNNEEKANSNQAFYEKYKRYYTPFITLTITAFFAYVASQLGKIPVGSVNGVPFKISASIWVLLIGATIGHFKLVPPKILSVGMSSGFFQMVVFARIIPSLAKITMGDLAGLTVQIVIIFGVTLLSLFVFIYLLPTWKLVGSKNLAIGISMSQLLGFPATYLIANEIANATAKTEAEKEYVLARIMPAYVIAGFVTVTSISVIMAGILKELL